MQALCWPGYVNILRFRWCPRYSLLDNFHLLFWKAGWFCKGEKNSQKAGFLCTLMKAFSFSHSQPNRVANSFVKSKEKAWALRCCTESQPFRYAKSLTVKVVAQQLTLELLSFWELLWLKRCVQSFNHWHQFRTFFYFWWESCFPTAH